MRPLFWMTLALCIVFNTAWAATPKNIVLKHDGLSVDELRNFATSLSVLPGNIQAIRIFHGTEGSEYSVALATFSEQSGWQIFVYNPGKNGRFELAWKSGKLDDTFYGASPDDLRVFNSGGYEDGIVFHGCAVHVCPDVFSVLLYVPTTRTAFTATYIWGKIKYSFDINDSKNNGYKSALDNLIHDELGPQ